MDFSNKSDVINKVISRTKKGQIIWKPTHIGSRGAFYLSEYTLTKTKKLILRFNINIDVWEMFLFICVKENGKEKTGLTIFSNDLRTDDFDILYHIIKYSDKKEVKRYIRVFASSDNRFVQLKFEDNGIGINEKEKEIIFNKFVRGSNANAVFPQGTGLGLAYCRAIISKHKGNIFVDQQNCKKPTIFVINFPLDQRYKK